MTNNIRSFGAAVALGLAGTMSAARAQYPSIPQDQGAAQAARSRAADQRSDGIFASHKSQLEADAARGKPYLPGASRPQDLPQAGIPAFPGAWGGGMYSFGGRDGKVYIVTSLEDSGPGTFREALEAVGPRIVIFNVSGIIRLVEKIRVRAPYITISGATAPGDGVCIAGNTVELETHDIVIRHLRFRRGATSVTERNDSLGGNPVGNVILDHLSVSWGLDENFSMYRHMYDHDNNPATPELKLPMVNQTIQWCISSEALNTFNHSFGSTLGGRNTLFMHNLYACNTGRNPSIGMGGDFNWINNVHFNWRHRTMDGSSGGSPLNVINNYYKPGPITNLNAPISYRIVKVEGGGGGGARGGGEVRPTLYVEGNIVDGNEKVTADNWAGGVQGMDREDAERDPETAKRAEERLPKLRAREPNKLPPVPRIESAKEAFESVLAYAGATLPKRDAVDERVAQMVRTGQVGTGEPDPKVVEMIKGLRFGGAESTRAKHEEIMANATKGIVIDPSQVGGYPDYKGAPHADADKDGLPDEFETKHGLNPNDASDVTADTDGDGYSNVEEFINGTNPKEKIDYKDLKNNMDQMSPGVASVSAPN
jgi:hypothetical protein